MKKLFVLSLVFLLMLGPCVGPGSSVAAQAVPENDDPTPAIADQQSAKVTAPAADSPQAPNTETVITLGNPITVTGSGVVISGTTATITDGGDYRATGTLSDGMIDVNTTEAVTLTLDTAVITHTSGPALNVTDATKLSLVLAAGTSNTLTDGENYSDTDLKAALFSNDTLEISGDGDLLVTGNYKHGIASDDDLIISGGNITITSTIKDGFHANDNITVSDGAITINQAGSDGFDSEGDFVVAGGALTLTVDGTGIKSTNAVTITDGAIEVVSAEEGIESEDSILVNAGALTLVVSDDGLNAANAITITGGQIYINATGDAVDSNGALTINDGVIVALGGESTESGLVCGDTYEIAFNGGTVVATGGTNSTPSSSSTQYVVELGSVTEGSAIHIERDDGTDVLTFSVSKAYQSMLFTSPDLLGSRDYTIYTGGTVSGGTDFYGLHTGATYSDGSVWTTFSTDAIVTYVNAVTTVYLPLVTRAMSSGTVVIPTSTPTPTATPTSSGETVITLGDPIVVSGSGVVISGTTATITDGGDYRATGTLSDGMIDVNTTDEVELILDGVDISNASGPAISVTDADKLSLVLAAGTSNTLTDGATYSDTDLKAALFSNDTLEISGDGDLLVTGNYKHGIASDDDLIISGGNITIVSTVKDGFHANDNITVSDGAITINQTGSDGFESEGDLVMTDGTLTLTVADDGVMSADTLTINGGTIEIISGVEGIESKNNIIVNDGALTLTVSDDGLNATNDITLNGGQIYVNATGDAVDSNGTLNTNDGVIVGLGGNTPEGGLDCDQCTITLDGGIVVATGGSNSTPSSSSTQYVAVLSSRPVGTVIHIERDDGTDVLTFSVNKTYQSMIFTSPDLLGSRTYTVYTGGSVSGGTEFHGLYTDATYSGGSTWTTFTTNNVVTYVGGGGPPGP